MAVRGASQVEEAAGAEQHAGGAGGAPGIEHDGLRAGGEGPAADTGNECAPLAQPDPEPYAAHWPARLWANPEPIHPRRAT